MRAWVRSFAFKWNRHALHHGWSLRSIRRGNHCCTAGFAVPLRCRRRGGAQQPTERASDESPGIDAGQIGVRLAAKEQRTAAQRKVSSQLLDARRAAVARRQATGADTADEMVTVDIRADVTPAVLERIRALGGTVINSVGRYRAIRARLPLAAVEPLAELDAIQSIRAGDKAITRGPLP